MRAYLISTNSCTHTAIRQPARTVCDDDRESRSCRCDWPGRRNAEAWLQHPHAFGPKSALCGFPMVNGAPFTSTIIEPHAGCVKRPRMDLPRGHFAGIAGETALRNGRPKAPRYDTGVALRDHDALTPNGRRSAIVGVLFDNNFALLQPDGSPGTSAPCRLDTLLEASRMTTSASVGEAARSTVLSGLT